MLWRATGLRPRSVRAEAGLYFPQLFDAAPHYKVLPPDADEVLEGCWALDEPHSKRPRFGAPGARGRLGGPASAASGSQLADRLASHGAASPSGGSPGAAPAPPHPLALYVPRRERSRGARRPRAGARLQFGILRGLSVGAASAQAAPGSAAPSAPHSGSTRRSPARPPPTPAAALARSLVSAALPPRGAPADAQQFVRLAARVRDHLAASGGGGGSGSLGDGGSGGSSGGGSAGSRDTDGSGSELSEQPLLQRRRRQQLEQARKAKRQLSAARAAAAAALAAALPFCSDRDDSKVPDQGPTRRPAADDQQRRQPQERQPAQSG